jgi:hypothetical protein
MLSSFLSPPFSWFVGMSLWSGFLEIRRKKLLAFVTNNKVVAWLFCSVCWILIFSNAGLVGIIVAALFFSALHARVIFFWGVSDSSIFRNFASVSSSSSFRIFSSGVFRSSSSTSSSPHMTHLLWMLTIRQGFSKKKGQGTRTTCCSSFASLNLSSVAA